MRVNVDSKALQDPRFKRLGKALGIDWHEALGVCIVAWNYAYESRSAVMSAEDVDAVVERDGFARAMVEADLAAVEGDQLRLRGVNKRIGFLLKQAERGRAGGKAKAAAQEAKKSRKLVANAKRTLKQDPSDLDLDQDQDQAPDPDQDQDQPLVLVPQPAPTKPSSSSASRSRSGEGEGAKAAIAFFCDRYQSKYSHSCTVTGRHAGQLQRLVTKHGAAEVQRRTENLFDAPPPFLAQSAPDLGTLVQHFDKLVIASPRPSPAARTNHTGRADPASADRFEEEARRGDPLLRAQGDHARCH